MRGSVGWTGRVRRRWWGGHEAERDVGFGRLKWVPLEEHHLEKIFKEINGRERDVEVLTQELERVKAELSALLLDHIHSRPRVVPKDMPKVSGAGPMRDPSKVAEPRAASELVRRTTDGSDPGLVNLLLTTAIVNTESSSRCDPPSSSSSSYSSDSSSSSSDSGSSCSSSD